MSPRKYAVSMRVGGKYFTDGVGVAVSGRCGGDGGGLLRTIWVSARAQG